MLRRSERITFSTSLLPSPQFPSASHTVSPRLAQHNLDFPQSHCHRSLCLFTLSISAYYLAIWFDMAFPTITLKHTSFPTTTLVKHLSLQGVCVYTEADKWCSAPYAPSATLNDRVTHNPCTCPAYIWVLSQVFYSGNYSYSIWMKSVVILEDYNSFFARGYFSTTDPSLLLWSDTRGSVLELRPFGENMQSSPLETECCQINWRRKTAKMQWTFDRHWPSSDTLLQMNDNVDP